MKESVGQLRALYLLDMLTCGGNVECIAFALFHSNSFASICEMIWVAFDPQDRGTIHLSGFTAAAIQLLRTLLCSDYFVQIALNPLHYAFFQQLLTDFVAMEQWITPKIAAQKRDALHRRMKRTAASCSSEESVAAEVSAMLPSMLEMMARDVECIVAILKPVVKLREQGFRAMLKGFATRIGFESAKFGFVVILEIFWECTFMWFWRRRESIEIVF